MTNIPNVGSRVTVRHCPVATDIREYVGRSGVVTRVITEPEPGYDADVLPVLIVRIGPEYVTLWGDEVEEST
jgi:hypothetical protein